MKCRKCGAETGVSCICPKCGYVDSERLTQNTQKAAKKAPEIPHGDPQPNLLALLKKLLPIVGCLLLLVVAFVLIIKARQAAVGTDLPVPAPAWEDEGPEDRMLVTDDAIPVVKTDTAAPEPAGESPAPTPTPFVPVEVWLADLDYFTCYMYSSNGPSALYESKQYDLRDNTGAEHQRVFALCGGEQCSQTYLLDGKYDGIKGTFYLRYEWKEQTAKATLTVYGDGKQLWTYNGMTTGVRPVNFDIDLNGVDELKIEVICDSQALGCFNLGDMLLYKNSD